MILFPEDNLDGWMDQDDEEYGEKTNLSGQSFADWMGLVDDALQAAVGLTNECMGDCDYYSMWLDEYKPKDAAARALDENGCPSELVRSVGQPY